ncbi:MAG: phosphoglycolate phosphatase [Thermoplasmata archaeon]|nr:phosphoglycolate phosphatase [Thermoplasmata archaeon]
MATRSPRPSAVVTDIDGTLTDRERRLDLGAIRTIRALIDRKVPVVLATGNVLPIALALYRSLGLSGPIVAENGGVIYRKAGGKETVKILTDRSVALAAYRHLEREGFDVEPLFTDRWRESEVALRPTVRASELEKALTGFPVVVEDTGYAVHLMSRGGGKLPALRRALRPLGLTPGDCVVAGDGDNDVPMLSAAGFAISFPSGSERARAAADYVAKARYARGFVEGIMVSGVLHASKPVRKGRNAGR